MTKHIYGLNVRFSSRALRVLVLSLFIAQLLAGIPAPQKALAAGATYYVDCQGNDSNSGTSSSQPWRSLAKANSAPLGPGDSMLFKRGCTWYGTVKARWNGNSTAKITIGAYGSGDRPKIQNAPDDLTDKFYQAFDITGSYQIIDNFETTITNPPVHTGCQNNPIGFFVGFHLRNPDNLPNGGSYNLVRLSKATRFMAGIHLGHNTHHNRVVRNTLSENNVMQTLTPTSVSSTDDIGAWGVVLKGRYQEVAYNDFSNNNAICTFDTPPQGNAVELYEAQNSTIHHNTSINDRDFSELGGSATVKTDNNIFAYNLVISSLRDSHFIITRGGGNMFGPVYRTRLFQNTVFYTGAESQGIICGAGCSSDILTARNNIIWAEWKAAFADGFFNESNNIYWNSSGSPFVQFQNFNMSGSSRTVNPQFVDQANRNFRLKSGSPAINKGATFSWKKDIDCVAVPQANIYDIGAYEFPQSTALTAGMEGEHSPDVMADTPVEGSADMPADVSLDMSFDPSLETSTSVDLSLSASPFKGFLPLIFSLSGAEAPVEAEGDGDWTYACP